MTVSELPTLSRRRFLQGAGLVIGFAIAPKGMATKLLQGDVVGATGEQAAMNAFVRIAPDGLVTVLSKHLEMGQGPYTGLTQLVAEELDADWEQMRVEASPADDDKYKNLVFGMQGTGGSTSIANSYDQFRKAGATARAMLVAAAAAKWGVETGEITVTKGMVSHPSGKSATFGELANDAASQTPPTDVTLKDNSKFTIIGKPVQRLDTPEKTNGKAVFTLDVKAKDMLIAVVAHPPKFGATVASFDATETKKVKGVVDVKQIPQGVAVYAENTFAALKGRDALKVEWDESNAETRSSAEIIAAYKETMKSEGIEATNKGDINKALAQKGSTRVDMEYVFPYLAHAPMEPLDAVLMKNDDGTIDCFSGAQFPGGDAKAVAEVCGVPREKVTLHVQLAGGSFGRRAQFGSPYMHEAAEVFKASGMKRPVKHMWTREDDIRGGFYRPIYVHKLSGTVDSKGNITGWKQVIAGQSIMGKKDLDETSVEGASDLAYNVPNLHVVSHNTQAGVPVLWWRSVGHTHTAYTVETFMDVLLEKAGKDPIDGRLALLPQDARERGVLEKLQSMLSKAGKAAEGKARGIAVHKSFNSFVAEAVEVSSGDDGMPKVHNVWIAVDCGVVVNPNHVKAQMEGGSAFGLGAVLFDEIELESGGKVRQSNFHNYHSLRMNDMPNIEVEIVSSTEKPTGVGEPGTPPAGPALANAWRRLTGQMVTTLPFKKAVKGKENMA